jgi:hypothetical protein
MVLGLVVAGLVVSGSSAQAFGRKRGHDNDCCAPSCEMQTEWVEKTVTCHRPEWREREVTCTVNRVHTREVVENRTCTVMVPEYRTEMRTVTVSKMVPVMVEKQVTVCKRVKETCVDPCTGCCKTVCRKVPVCETVRKCEKQCVQEQKQVCVKVCTMRPETKTYQVKRLVCETRPETVVRKERYCEMVPYQTTVKVAVCKPVCAPTAACGEAASCCH